MRKNLCDFKRVNEDRIKNRIRRLNARRINAVTAEKRGCSSVDGRGLRTAKMTVNSVKHGRKRVAYVE